MDDFTVYLQGLKYSDSLDVVCLLYKVKPRALFVQQPAAQLLCKCQMSHVFVS